MHSPALLTGLLVLLLPSTLEATPLGTRDTHINIHTRHGQPQRARLTFHFAPDSLTASKSVPVDGYAYLVNETLSASHITLSAAAADVRCFVVGAQGGLTVVRGNATVDVGPPQPPARAACLAGASASASSTAGTGDALPSGLEGLLDLSGEALELPLPWEH
ncbi:hypothetical protein AAE478_002319 [Parahypoxylon ruwenzoriense]